MSNLVWSGFFSKFFQVQVGGKANQGIQMWLFKKNKKGAGGIENSVLKKLETSQNKQHKNRKWKQRDSSSQINVTDTPVV